MSSPPAYKRVLTSNTSTATQNSASNLSNSRSIALSKALICSAIDGPLVGLQRACVILSSRLCALPRRLCRGADAPVVRGRTFRTARSACVVRVMVVFSFGFPCSDGGAFMWGLQEAEPPTSEHDSATAPSRTKPRAAFPLFLGVRVR